MRILYLDSYAGISGDMTLGAFVDLEIEPGYLISELEKLGVRGYTVEIGKKKKNGLVGTDVDVILEADKENQGCHKVQKRAYKDIKELIDKSTLDEKVKILSKKIFHYVVEAEGKIHGQPIDEVHFHEVGTIDSIVAGLVERFEPLPECKVVNIGYGCGKRETKMGSLLRMILVETK